MEIREAEARDAEAVTRLLEGLGHPVDIGLVHQRILGFRDSDRDTVLVAVDDGEPVGVLAMTVGPRFAGEGSWARIIALAVDPGSQRAGVGRQLVDEAERRATRAGSVVVQVSSGKRSERQAAHRFYPSLGYHDADEHHVAYQKDLRP